jgi:ATP diphosphatase
MNPFDKAHALGCRAAQDGFDWACPLLAMEKVQEEVAELMEALQQKDSGAILEELGDLLFSLVQVARLAKIDATHAMDEANIKFLRRYEGMHQLLENQVFSELTLPEQEALWQRVKQDIHQ